MADKNTLTLISGVIIGITMMGCLGFAGMQDQGGEVNDEPVKVTEEQIIEEDASEVTEVINITEEAKEAEVIEVIEEAEVAPEAEVTEAEKPKEADHSSQGVEEAKTSKARQDWDTDTLECGVNAKPAIDQDKDGNWWAYCEPALVD